MAADVGAGQLQLLNGDGALSYLSGCAIGTIEVRRGTDGLWWRDWAPVLRGRGETAQPSLSRQQARRLTLDIYDLRGALDDLVETRIYGGTNVAATGYDGTAENGKGNTVPLCLGEPPNASAVQVNASSRSWQWDAGPADGMTAFWDGGAAAGMTFVASTSGAGFDGVSLSATQYATDAPRGLIKLSAGNAAVLDENSALTATLSGGVWARPLDNLLDPTVKEVTARCTSGDIADAWFDVVFPDRAKFDTLVLAGGTLHRAAGYRLTWYSDPVDRSAGSVLAGGPSTPVLPVYPRVGRAASSSYFQKNWWRLGPSERDLAGKTRQLVARPPASPRCRALRVEIDNRGASLDLGHLFVTRAFRPEWPHDWGLVIEPVNSSPVDTTPGGRRIVDVRPAPRRKTVRFVDLSEDEGMRFFDMGQRLGSIGPLLMVEDITQTRHLWRRTWLATLEAGGIGVTQNDGDLWSAELKLLEIIG